MTEPYKVIGAVAWPYLQKPGYAMVMSVHKTDDLKYTVHIEDEAEARSILGVAREVIRINSEYNEDDDKHAIEEWYGDAANEAIMDLIYRALPMFSEVPFMPAPHMDDKKEHTRLYLDALRDWLNAEDKVLFLGKSRIASHLAVYARDDRKKIEHYPPVSCLGYGVTALYLWLNLHKQEEPLSRPAQIIKDTSRRDYHPVRRSNLRSDNDFWDEMDSRVGGMIWSQ